MCRKLAASSRTHPERIPKNQPTPGDGKIGCLCRPFFLRGSNLEGLRLRPRGVKVLTYGFWGLYNGLHVEAPFPGV